MVAMSEKVFPDPFKFDPERSLGNKELRRYQVTFSKGIRACLGMKKPNSQHGYLTWNYFLTPFQPRLRANLVCGSDADSKLRIGVL